MSRRSRPARIRSALEELLADGPHRAVAARLGEQIRADDGRRRGADLLERLVPHGVSDVG